MSGRRRDARYRLSAPCEGSLEIIRDVVIERLGAGDVLALSDAAHPPGMELILDAAPDAGRPAVHVRVRQCTPVVADGIVRYRLRFAIVE